MFTVKLAAPLGSHVQDAGGVSCALVKIIKEISKNHTGKTICSTSQSVHTRKLIENKKNWVELELCSS